MCRAYTGDLDGALADADMVIELGRVDAAAYYVRGSIRAERGDVPEARADLREQSSWHPRLSSRM